MLRLSSTALLLLLSSPALAAPSGYEVAKKAHDMNVHGYVGQRFTSVMTLFDKDGSQVVTYQLVNMSREGTPENKDVTKSLLRFTAPASSKGTALLTHEPKNGDESRWLYLAESRQVKQIASGSKSSSFKGSELAYEDMNMNDLERYDYKLLGEQTVKGRKLYKVERKPKFADSGYSKTISWFDAENYYVIRVDFFDKAGKLLKVANYDKFKKVGKQWRAHLASISNVQTKKKTVVVSGTYKLGLKLPETLFTVSQLQKQ